MRSPNFLSLVWSDLENLLLSHPDSFFFAGVAPAAARLTCFDLPITGVVDQLEASNEEKL